MAGIPPAIGAGMTPPNNSEGDAPPGGHLAGDDAGLEDGQLSDEEGDEVMFVEERAPAGNIDLGRDRDDDPTASSSTMMKVEAFFGEELSHEELHDLVCFLPYFL